MVLLVLWSWFAAILRVGSCRLSKHISWAYYAGGTCKTLTNLIAHSCVLTLSVHCCVVGRRSGVIAGVGVSYILFHPAAKGTRVL